MIMNWWIKLGCILTGWNSDVLAQCSEASRSHLSKYTSALLILILIWGVTGFCFAQRYIGLPWWGCIMISLFFITIVVMIERQIILTIGKSLSMLLFRAAIAFVMAIIGSTIFDQTLFGKDIDKQMANTIEIQVEELTKKRVRVIDEKIALLRFEIDSLDQTNALLQADVNAHPFIIQKSVTNTTSKVVMPDGEIKTLTTPSITSNQVANPKQTIIEANNNRLKDLRKEENKWSEKKQTVEEDVRQECKASVGFLEELEAMWEIISTRKLAGAFYLIFFTFLMSLELFVVVSKLVDKECDYEVAIMGAQKVRITQFGNAYNRVCA
jgi:hypothetical protein